MKVKELIEKLNAYNPDLEVCVFDWRKNLHHQDDFGTSIGVESKFEVSLMTPSKAENDRRKQEGMERAIPWLSIAFENNDYDDCGSKPSEWSESDKKHVESSKGADILLCGKPVFLDLESTLLKAGKLFTLEEANKFAKKTGGRLMTTKEQRCMKYLKSRWCKEILGRIFTFKTPDGKDFDVFLPAAGGRDTNGSRVGSGEVGGYWSCSLYNGNPRYMCFNSSGVTIADNARPSHGLSVLIVKDI